MSWIGRLLAVMALVTGGPAAAQAPPGEAGRVFHTGPGFYAGFAAVVLTRVASGPDPILVVDERVDGLRHDDRPLLRQRDLDLTGFRPGFELRAGWRLQPGWWLTGEFLMLSTARAAQSAPGAAMDTGFPGGAAGALFNFNDGDRYAASLRSDLFTVRLGIRRNIAPWLRVSAGLRYLNLTDRLDVRITGDGDNEGPAIDHRFTLAARNHLIGPEIGASLRYPIAPALNLRFDTSFGVLAAISDADRRFIDSKVLGTLEFKNKRTGLSILSENRLSLEYKPHERVTISAGYRVLHVTGVATAGTNGNPTIAANGYPAHLGLARGSLTYHGGFAGLRIAI